MAGSRPSYTTWFPRDSRVRARHTAVYHVGIVRRRVHANLPKPIGFYRLLEMGAACFKILTIGKVTVGGLI